MFKSAVLGVQSARSKVQSPKSKVSKSPRIDDWLSTTLDFGRRTLDLNSHASSHRHR